MAHPMLPAFWVAHSLQLEQVLFAKLAVLYMAFRVAYVALYALDSNALRTTSFMAALFSLQAIAFGALFPGKVLPLLA